MGQTRDDESEPVEFIKERSKQAMRDTYTVRSQMGSFANHARDIQRDRDKNPDLADFALELIGNETMKTCKKATAKKTDFHTSNISKGEMTMGNNNSPMSGLVLEAETLSSSELAQFEQGMQASNLGEFIKATTKRLWMTRNERKHLKEVHLQVTKDAGRRYRLAINMMIDGRIQKMKNELVLEAEGDIQRLSALLGRVTQNIAEMTQNTMQNIEQTARGSVRELRGDDDVDLGFDKMAQRFYQNIGQNYLNDMQDIHSAYSSQIRSRIGGYVINIKSSRKDIESKLDDFRSEFDDL